MQIQYQQIRAEAENIQVPDCVSYHGSKQGWQFFPDARDGESKIWKSGEKKANAYPARQASSFLEFFSFLHPQIRFLI